MRRLPKLSAGRSVWTLPLSETAAGVLAEAFLFLPAADSQAAVDLIRILHDEPPLVLWAVCRADRWQHSPPPDIASVAHWLLDSGLQALQWGVDERALTTSADDRERARWCRLAVESVAVAQAASRLAGNDNPEQLYLLGLLHAAPQWLSICGAPVSVPGCKPGTSCLPAWLVQFLQETAEVPPRTFRARIVSQAVRTLPAAVETTAVGDADRGGDQHAAPAQPELSAAMRMRQRWLAADTRCGNLLPALMGKLQRLGQLENDFQRTLETEKLESLKALAYGASHEINNPLANISTRAQTLLREETDPERRRKLSVINSQAFRAHELIADMMLFARPPELVPRPANLTAIVDEALAEIAHEAQDQGTVVERITSDDPVPATVDAGHLAVAIRAVCTNSLEAVGSGGRIEIFVQACDPPADSTGGPWVEILVSDTGPGIPLEVRGHLFDPYFSGREAGRGLGLGLSKTWRIVTEHGGRIDVESQPNHGTTFAIRLPRDACPTVRTAS
jgi:signal transduction histidine kinase